MANFEKIFTPSTFFYWKTRFKTHASSCSGFFSEAMLLIKDVAMVDSLDDFESSRPIKGTQVPNFEMLDARIASSREGQTGGPKAQ